MKNKRETVRIGYREYTISFVKRFTDGDHIGECENPAKHTHAKGKIRIKAGQEPVEKANTIMHEINHAIAYTYGLNLSDDMEERVVTAFTNGLIAFIRDNPKFVIKLLRLALKG